MSDDTLTERQKEALETIKAQGEAVLPVALGAALVKTGRAVKVDGGGHGKARISYRR